MGTMHRAIDRPLTLHVPEVRPLPRVMTGTGMNTVRIVLGTASVAIVGGICLGFILGYAAGIAMQVGP